MFAQIDCWYVHAQNIPGSQYGGIKGEGGGRGVLIGGGGEGLILLMLRSALWPHVADVLVH